MPSVKNFDKLLIHNILNIVFFTITPGGLIVFHTAERRS